jgi:hypothetical protein
MMPMHIPRRFSLAFSAQIGRGAFYGDLAITTFRIALAANSARPPR